MRLRSTYEVEHGRLELDALGAQADQEGGVVGGIESSLEPLERASDRRAALSERLPTGRRTITPLRSQVRELGAPSAGCSRATATG
ncbi:MAG: hypothetical protein JSS68_03100 [Actinobacteria bacterium]|nr:hypothetical protein [Actinomycetota bacterium]